VNDTCKTIAGTSEGTVTEQRSKFIARAHPVQTQEEIKNIIAGYRKQYYDARHICWAYMLGAERETFRVNDDGEPSSTAGKPILGAINSRELTDVLVVVVRYFGGVKLGVGGLAAAYKAAAHEALSRAEIVEKTVDEAFEISFEYPFLNSMMRIVKEENPEVLSQVFDMDCRMQLRIRKSKAAALKQRLLQVETARLIPE
jgi:uncharacterized YigZ family protein